MEPEGKEHYLALGSFEWAGLFHYVPVCLPSHLPDGWGCDQWQSSCLVSAWKVLGLLQDWGPGEEGTGGSSHREGRKAWLQVV